MKTQIVDLSKILKNYSNIWIALDPTSQKVVATGNKPKSVLADAREKGTSEPILTRAPKDYGAYIL